MQRQCMPRFFAMTDVEKITPLHQEYKKQVQAYFHRLFPQREWQIVSDCNKTPLAIDVEVLYPTVEEPFYVLHTMGMSTAPLHCPTGLLPQDKEMYTELSLILPADWPFHPKQSISLSDPAGWPVWLLMELGRFPHVHHTWMAYGFLLANTEQQEPFSSQASFAGVTIVQFDGELGEIPMQDGQKADLLMPLVLYKEEMDLCDIIGVDAVVEKILEETGGSFALDGERKNVASHT